MKTKLIRTLIELSNKNSNLFNQVELYKKLVEQQGDLISDLKKQIVFLQHEAQHYQATCNQLATEKQRGIYELKH